MTVVHPEEADAIWNVRQSRVTSSWWKETDSGHVAKARWCVHGFKGPRFPRN